MNKPRVFKELQRGPDKGKLLSDAQIRKLIQNTCTANGCPKLAATIEFGWTNHIKSKTGTFSLCDNAIKLAARVLERLDAERQAEAVSRETCHLICWHLFNNTAHEALWRQCMANAGYPNATCKQSLPFKDLKRKAYKSETIPFFFSCGCRKKAYQLNAIVAKNIALDGEAYECSECHKQIKLVRNEIAEAS